MIAQRLSPAMRNMLRNIIDETPSSRGLAGGALKHAAIHTKLRLNQPNWSEAMVLTQAKHQYEAHIAGRSLEAAPC